MGFCARGPSETEQRAARKLDYSALSSRLCLLRQTFFLRETNHTSTKPPRLLLVCVSVGLTPLLGMRGIFRVRYWKFTSLCRWTLQPGNIRSDPIRQNKSCSPVPRGCGGGGGGRLPNGKVGDASSPDSKLNPADSEFEPKNGTESVFQLLSLTVHHKRYFDS